MYLRIVALLAASALSACESKSVWIANGLDIPVSAAVEGHEPVVVAPNGWARLDVGRDEAPVEVVASTEDGRELERQVVTPGGDGVCSVYSVLAAAPLESGNAFYAPGDGPSVFISTTEKQKYKRYHHVRVARESNIEFCLEEAPDKVRLDSDKRVTKRWMRVEGDWRLVSRILEQVRKPPERLAFLKEIVAAQPDVAESSEQLAAAEKAANPRKPHPTLDWHAMGPSGNVRARQWGDDEESCVLLCEERNQKDPVWEKQGCLSRAENFHFVSDDCEHLVVVKRVGGQPLKWREAPVVSVYRRGVLEQELPAGRFIQEESFLRPSGAGFLWLRGAPVVTFATGELHLSSADGKSHKVQILRP